MTPAWCKLATIPARATRAGVDPVNGQRYAAGEFEPVYIPRQRMPQIEPQQYPALLRLCRARHVSVTRATVNPASLKVHQRAPLSEVQSLTPAQLRVPVLVSADGYVLDGNHRRAGHLRAGTRCPVLRLGLPFCAAARLLFSLPGCHADRAFNAHQCLA